MISDDQLTETGLPAPATVAGASVLVIACGALAREILALIKMNGWTHMALQCLPAKYHLTPDKIIDAVEAAVEKYRADYDQIFIAYADCGTGGQLQTKCAELGVEMIAGPHCYSFFEGNDAFEKNEDDLGTFYLTDFLVKQFDAFIWKPMGLDRHPELLDMYFSNYTKLVYQAQVEDTALQIKAKACAKRLGLDYEYRFTGYG
ncbi:MAG: DUF1638 domain-containing protein, partial [Pseudomonadota bacterium]